MILCCSLEYARAYYYIFSGDILYVDAFILGELRWIISVHRLVLSLRVVCAVCCETSRVWEQVCENLILLRHLSSAHTYTHTPPNLPGVHERWLLPCSLNELSTNKDEFERHYWSELGLIKRQTCCWKASQLIIQLHWFLHCSTRKRW